MNRGVEVRAYQYAWTLLSHFESQYGRVSSLSHKLTLDPSHWVHLGFDHRRVDGTIDSSNWYLCVWSPLHSKLSNGWLRLDPKTKHKGNMKVEEHTQCNVSYRSFELVKGPKTTHWFKVFKTINRNILFFSFSTPGNSRISFSLLSASCLQDLRCQVEYVHGKYSPGSQ